MDSNKFTEDDKEKVIEFLNLVAKHAEFKLDTQALIKYFKCLAHMQQSIVPKIEANIFEVKKITEAKEDSEKEE